MLLEYGYGTGTQKVRVADNKVLCQLSAASSGSAGEITPEFESGEVLRALAEPIGSPALCKCVKPGEKVAIVTSDITRPMPTYKVIVPILNELNKGGVPDENIVIVSALGSHRHQTAEEHEKLIGKEACQRVKVIDSDPDDCVHLGVTSRGTPVDITRSVAEADRRILLGNIEFHYFAGFSGGVKALMPGVSTPAAIQCNHSHMVEEGSAAGILEGNPVREDIEEAGRIAGADFIFNVVLDSHKHIVKAFAGDPVKAHREGAAFLRNMYGIKIPALADIVICSQGGAPKDLNLYQTQKALDNAKHAVKPGGVIILIGACGEGMGNKVFGDWMLGAKSPDEIIDRLRKGFVLGGHKAAAIALVEKKADIYLVSEIDPETVKKMFMTPFTSVNQAYRTAQKRFGGNGTVISMPFGGSTLPILA